MAREAQGPESLREAEARMDALLTVQAVQQSGGGVAASHVRSVVARYAN